MLDDIPDAWRKERDHPGHACHLLEVSIPAMDVLSMLWKKFILGTAGLELAGRIDDERLVAALLGFALAEGRDVRKCEPEALAWVLHMQVDQAQEPLMNHHQYAISLAHIMAKRKSTTGWRVVWPGEERPGGKVFGACSTKDECFSGILTFDKRRRVSCRGSDIGEDPALLRIWITSCVRRSTAAESCRMMRP